MKLFDDLKWRGLIQEISSPELERLLNEEKLTFYIGTDPTADSMHIGHYSSFLIAKRLANYGHHPILLVGGATGLIGDPKPNAERPMITKEEVNKNIIGLRNQAEKIFGMEVVNNYDWTKDINVLDYLRDYGKYFNVSYMLGKEKVQSRLETGITYAEFSYMILQALDFMYLYEHKNCLLQVAGSDQWGNITAGIELVRKKLNKEIYGMVMPLVTDSTGVKFGKTEGNALWLDIDKTSSYELYQYFVNLEDSMIIEYLKKLTFLNKEEITLIEEEHLANPENRNAHKRLAFEVIKDLHGEEEYEKAVKLSETLFEGDISNFSSKDVESVFRNLTPTEIKEDINILDFLVNNDICSSKREAREFISSGSILINGKKIQDLEFLVTKEVAIDNRYLVVRRGKKKYYLVEYK